VEGSEDSDSILSRIIRYSSFLGPTLLISYSADKLVLLLKTSIRLNFQESIRFAPSGILEKLSEVRRILRELLKEIDPQ
jgi:hypothetical protein